MASSTQETIDGFWKLKLGESNTKTRPPTVLPQNVYTQLVGDRMPQGTVTGKKVDESYHKAVKDCKAKVDQIVRECRRTNTKYSDPHFDLDDRFYCLRPLTAQSDSTPPESTDSGNTITYDITQRTTTTGSTPIYWGNVQPLQGSDDSDSGGDVPPCAKRVGAIFENPKFFVEKTAHVKEIRQGAEGDCWMISSLGSLCVDEKFPKLIEKICPAELRDEKVGVYGFVFSRDGEWISEIIDDKLYLKTPDYDDCTDERRSVWDMSHSRLDPDVSRKLYRKTFQTNSDALYFASCAHPDETWVPLLEKAFAKAHGDFDAIDGGWPGEGVEDLTGGITTEIVSADILDLDELWTNGFLKVNVDFLFGAGTRQYDRPDPNEQGRQGIEDGHAYSVLKAVEYKGTRLLSLKNPWGQSEWTGEWSDGSKEWTADAIETLGYTFGNDGIFWMPFADFLERYVQIWRTRLFSPEWSVSQHWTTIQVPWSTDFNGTKFTFEIPEATRSVIVLSQLDSRYFGGLKGQYSFQLAFRLHQAGGTEYIVRGYSSGDRSAVAEVDLEAGKYEVLMQISGDRDTSLPKVEDVVKQNWLSRRDKLIRIGLSYDLANAKGRLPDPEPEPKIVVETASDTKAEAATATPDVPLPTQGQTATPEPETAPSERPASHLGVPYGLGASYAGSVAAPASVAPASVSGDAGPEGGDEPWNATVVVGLRVFCQAGSAAIDVVFPPVEEPLAVKASKLDVDDPEKDVVQPKTDAEIKSSVEAKVDAGAATAEDKKEPVKA